MVKIVNAFIGLILIHLLMSGCQSNSQKKSLTPEEQAKYISQGKSIVMNSFKAFTQELTKALEDGGVQHAVNYCHLNASPLIDSLSKVSKAKIIRVSEKFRNPADKPGTLDLKVLKAYQEQLDAGNKLQPHLEVTENELIYYAPILILDPLCLNCHGEPGVTMLQENHDFIKSKYTSDLAFGYKLGDLRGAWKIVLNPEF